MKQFRFTWDPAKAKLNEKKHGVSFRGSSDYLASKIVAMPWPAPMHMVARPNFALRSSIAWISVVAMRAPLAPSGWPMAMAPPRTLTFSGSAFSSLMTASAWDGEGLVDLDQVDVCELQAGPFEGLVRRRHRADAHDGRIDAGDRHRADLHLRLQAQLLGAFLRHDEQARPRRR